jgi:hypothetical protein
MKREIRTVVQFGKLACLILLVAGAAGCAGAHRRQTATGPDDGSVTRSDTVEQYGIEITSIRRSALDSIIDVRYKITDEDKAAFMMDRTKDSFMLDQASGKVVAVPDTSRIGPLRTTMRFGKPTEGRTYFILFGNPGKVIYQGSKVTLIVGDMKVRDLVVE